MRIFLDTDIISLMEASAMSQPSALAELLVKLSVDPELRRPFKESPREFMAEAGLSDEEIDLVSGGNPDEIRDYLGGDAPAGCFALIDEN
ncbi:MAG TPA: hypothetical protein VGX68_14815 [Thermoanaerobaculia bacterium]|jgi:hypothetical protein|nr:hypothetical protein [Thermoanaerobaculia bacterium]